MDNPINQTNVIAQSLYDATSIEDKFSILEDEIKAAGFDGVLYSFIPKLSRLTDSLQPVFQFPDSFSDLLNWYQENDISRHDFTIRLIEDGKLDIIDWWEEAKHVSLSKQELRVNQVISEKFGITKGISLPTLSSDLGVAAVSIISFKEEYRKQKVDPVLLSRMRSIARIYHDHIMVHQDDRYKFILPILRTLTHKKKVVIKHLITGQPMKTIVDMGVTERYADKLLMELRKTFGDISKNELIYLLGFLNIAEYL